MKKDQLRPQRLADYYGQDHIKEPLLAAITSAKARGAPLEHVLLSGPPGLGKTTLAMIIAREMDWPMVDYIGSTVGNPTGFSMKIMGLEGKHMLFIDEVHALRKQVQEILYPVMEDNRILFKRGAASAEFNLPPLTIMGATTDLGKLAQPFIDRFQLAFELRFYETDELEELGRASALRLNLGHLPEEVLEPIAERCRGTPRYMNRYLKWIRDYKIFEKTPSITKEYVEHVLWKKLHIDDLGLRPLDRNYLRVLDGVQGTLGLEAIASRLRQAAVTLENYVEPYLLYTELMERNGKGRCITEIGRDHLESLRRKK